MKTDHKSLGDRDAGWDFAELCRVDGIQPDRLFTQHMLACPRRGNGQWDMQMVGQRIVDCIDFGIG